MDDEVVVGGRNGHWYGQLTNKEILGSLPEPPSFPEDIALVRDRVRKIIGKASVPRVLTVPHPAIERLLAEDDRLEVGKLSQLEASYQKPSRGYGELTNLHLL